MTDREIIARYMRGVIRAQDGRGAARNEAELYRALVPNTTPTIARMTAAACRAVGEAIAGVAR